jgi:hypothetical protein
MGVYRVRNKVTGKALIGSSVNLPAILNRHRSELRMGGHRNRTLQKDWNDLGADAFEFEELDRLQPSEKPGYDPSYDLSELERLWLERLAPIELYG